MNNRACYRNLSWAFFLVVFLLAACSTTPPVKYYTLNALPEMQQQNPGAMFAEDIAIGVGPVEFPKFLDRPQIVTRKSQNQVEVSEFHRWASSLRGDFTRVLAKNISILLPTNRVAVHPWGDQFSPTYRIRLDVEQFDGEFGGKVLLNVTWSVADQEGTDELVVKNTLIREPISGKDYEALVVAESQALATLSRAIVDELSRLR
jgi:uncharacterized lipoprotein YmbA